MSFFVKILRADTTLSGAQRTALGLGAVGVDLRDAAVRAEVIEVLDGNTGMRVLDAFNYAFQRSATTRTALVSALRTQAQTIIDAETDASYEGGLVGRLFKV